MFLLVSFSANADLVSQKHLPFAGLMAEKAQMLKLSFLLQTWRFDPADQLLLNFPLTPLFPERLLRSCGLSCPMSWPWHWFLRLHSWLIPGWAVSWHPHQPSPTAPDWGWTYVSLGSSTSELHITHGPMEPQLSEATFREFSTNTHSMCCTDRSSPLPFVRDIPGSSQKQRRSLLSAFCFQQRQLCSPRNGPVRAWCCWRVSIKHVPSQSS